MEKIKLLKISDIAAMFDQPKTWVYRHWRDLGGFKLGGKIFFRLDKLEKIILKLENVSQQIPDQIRGPVAVPLQPENQNVLGSGISNQEGSPKRRSQRKAFFHANRHGLLV